MVGGVGSGVARGHALAMGHQVAQAAALGIEGAQRGHHDAGRGAGADEGIAVAEGGGRLLPVEDEGERAGAAFIQPHFDRPVPGGGKTFRIGPLPQQIGRARRATHAARGGGDNAASGQGIDERMLRIGRPPPRPGTMARDGGEVKGIG